MAALAPLPHGQGESLIPPARAAQEGPPHRRPLPRLRRISDSRGGCSSRGRGRGSFLAASSASPGVGPSGSLAVLSSSDSLAAALLAAKQGRPQWVDEA